jgi:hypothetical protein
MLHRLSSQVAGHLFRNRANKGPQARTLTYTAEAGTSNLRYHGSSSAPLSDSRRLITSRGSQMISRGRSLRQRSRVAILIGIAGYAFLLGKIERIPEPDESKVASTQ